LWLNFRYYLGISMASLREKSKYLRIADVQAKIQKLASILYKSELLSPQLEPTYLVHVLLKAHVTKVVAVVIIGCSSVKCLFINVVSRTQIPWVGFTLSWATKALRESRGIHILYFLTSALEGGEGSASRPGRTTNIVNVHKNKTNKTNTKVLFQQPRFISSSYITLLLTHGSVQHTYKNLNDTTSMVQQHTKHIKDQ